MEAGVAIGAFKVFSNTLSFFLFLHHAFFLPELCRVSFVKMQMQTAV